jgi:hypothetical protein
MMMLLVDPDGSSEGERVARGVVETTFAKWQLMRWGGRKRESLNTSSRSGKHLHIQGHQQELRVQPSFEAHEHASARW